MAKLYVAYGSNLNKRQMKGRCPGAKFVGTGVIENYALQFKGSLYGAHATIAPQEGSFVPVGLWTIQSRDENRLDMYEGYRKTPLSNTNCKACVLSFRSYLRKNYIQSTSSHKK